MNDNLQDTLKKKIAFSRVFSSVPIARSVPEMLAHAFPEYEVETITITQLLKPRIDILFINGLITIRDQGLKILWDKKAFRRAFLRTPFIFRRVKRLLANRLSRRLEEYAFSFQLQSLFDCSVPELPHFVYTDHTHLANLEYLDFNKNELSSAAWLHLEKMVYQNAERIFTRSTNISRSLVKHYDIPAGKVACVFAGTNVPVDEIDVQMHESLGQNILFVGIDWHRKGGPDLVQAFQKVQAEYPQATLTIVGCDPVIDLPNTSVIGLLPVEKLSKYYREADIFCLPTHLEPFGIVFIEALSYGLPIVATDTGAIPDFVIEGENGYLVPVGDVDLLASRLIDIVSDLETQQVYGQNSRKIAVERYNWKSVGTAIRQQVISDLDLAVMSDTDNPVDHMRPQPKVYA